ncbi:MAG: TonB-dependent receptor [Elusimicrobia bacterium]|jgi:iron complex outermembrane receptor protein|nr:TonB-dependent receptor [Elusimicrobiota bacterium]MBK7574248.1 TonB-dependent receptor [Elusimicrobiota bacterium]MBK8126395.1 TonB-dependent receptor [Elusimicrobiota bacterium]MBK8423211.1 TonB-dependent receptor [Elusimicrobiota bacterium]MBK8650106.1 TonB-dependent receptor [Elusimicrobiota bacterium]
MTSIPTLLRRSRTLSALLFSAAFPAAAEVDVFSLDLEQLLKTDITVTSVSNKEESLGRAAAAIHVLTAEEIRQSGARSVPDLLRLVPGLYVAQIDGGGWAVSARGFADRYNNKMLVLRDGRSLYSPFFAGTYWDLQDTLIDDIERIEVIRGPGGTIWGANAVNGVINIVTKSAHQTQGGFLQAGGGTFEQSHGALRWGGKAAGGALRVYGQGAAFNNTVDNDGEDRNDARRAYRGGMRFDRSSEDGSVMAQAEIYNHPARNTYRVAELAPGGVTLWQDDFVSRGGHALVDAQRRIGARNRLGLRVYYDRAERTQSYIQPTYDTLDAQTQHTYDGDRHGVVWGAGFRWWQDHSLGSTVGTADQPSHTHRTYSAFLQDEIKIVPRRWSVTAGSKLEWNDFTGTEIQPRLNTALSLNDDHTVWGAVSRAVRTPSQVEDTGAFRYLLVATFPATVFGVIRGDSELKAETLMAYEVGYRGRPTPRTGLDIVGFYNRYERLINIDRTAPLTFAPLEKPLPWTNSDPGCVYGGEASGRWNPSRVWTLSSAYSFYQEHLRTADRFEASYPKHMGRLQSYWDMTPTLGMTNTALYYSTIDLKHADRAFRIDAYWRVDLALSWRPAPTVEFLVAGRNLLDPRHPEYGTIIFDAAGQVPRSVYAQVTLKTR